MLKKDISRRDFLKGAAYGAAGLAAVGLLGGCAAQAPTPQATDAPETAAPQETQAPSWGAPAEVATADGSAMTNISDYTDVVVIGGGLAGLCAAAQAGESYCAAYLLEMRDTLGGSFEGASGVFGAGSAMQQEAGLNDLTVDSVNKELLKFQQGSADMLVSGECVRRSADNIQWLMDKGVRFSSVDAVGDSLQTLHRFAQPASEIVQRLTDVCNQYGVNIRTGVTAQKIFLNEDGKICGVSAKDKDGNAFSIECSCVILATGGFADNPVMLKDYADLAEGRYFVPKEGNRSGSGIKMGVEIGAAMAARKATLLGVPGMLPHDTVGSELFVLSVMEPVLWLNGQGHRFMDESLCSRDFAAAFNAACSQQTIFSVMPKSYIDECASIGCRAGCPMLNIPAGTKLSNVWTQIEEMAALDPESIIMGDDISAIMYDIQDVGLDMMTVMRLQETYYADQNDPEFGKDPRYIVPCTEGPFYVFRLRPAVLATLGGLKTSIYASALKDDGNYIEGLYAAGSDAGSATGFTCADALLPGFAQSWAVNSGRLAAKEVAFTLGAGP